MFALTGKTALVTGGAQGIGKASAQALANMGANVVLADINEARLQETASEIRAQGGNVFSVVMNVCSNDSISAAVKAAAEHFGGIDIVVNSAGILGTSSIEEMDRDAEWNRVLDIDLTGTFFVCQYALLSFL